MSPEHASPGRPEQANRMMWDGRPGHYEVWYLTLSHRATRTGFWIRHTIEAPKAGDGEPYAQLWFSRFDPAAPDRTFGVNKKHPISAFAAAAEPFSVEIAGSTARHDGWRGGFESNGRRVAWDLAWTPGRAAHEHLPSMIYKLGSVDTKVCSPNPDLRIGGTITVDGEELRLDGDPGAQSHVWGRKHAYSWAWSHCNAFEDRGAPVDNAFFESVSVKLKRGQIILPTITLMTLHLDEGEIAFRDPWTLPLARSTWQTGRYHLIGANADTRVEAEFTCRPDETLMAEYLDPDGDPAFNHICCCADVQVTVRKRSPFVGRWRDHRTLVAPRMAHFEWAARAGDVLRVKKSLQPG